MKRSGPLTPSSPAVDAEKKTALLRAFRGGALQKRLQKRQGNGETEVPDTLADIDIDDEKVIPPNPHSGKMHSPPHSTRSVGSDFTFATLPGASPAKRFRGTQSALTSPQSVMEVADDEPQTSRLALDDTADARSRPRKVRPIRTNMQRVVYNSVGSFTVNGETIKEPRNLILLYGMKVWMPSLFIEIPKLDFSLMSTADFDEEDKLTFTVADGEATVVYKGMDIKFAILPNK
jgi:hypothetical protein